MKTTIPVHDNINPETPLDPDDLFFIRKVVHQPDGNVLPPLHRHPFYEMIFVLQGEGTFKIDFQDYPLKKGALYLFSPGQTHIGNPKKDLAMYLLRFEAPIFQEKKFFDNISIFNFDSLYLEGADYKEIESSLCNLYEEFSHERELKEMTINNLLKLLLIKVQRLLPAVVNCNVQTSLFNELNTLMEENGYKNATPSEYAKKLKVPAHTLSAMVKEYTGMTSGEYIRAKTIIEVKRLLYYTDLNTNEIAWQLGFADAGYFSRFFKREAGVPPTEFRKMILDNKNERRSS